MTNCPTCGMPVKVVGNVTKHYEPVIKLDEEKIAKLIQVTIHGVDCTVRDYPIDKLAKAISEALPDLIKEF